MGEAESLTRLLTYGMENRPAEEYALILWNHGGGPLEGVCWDELFSMDRLSLKELTSALGAARMEKKLKWIGFDACLMCSAEVASAMAPYAEYMVASQETEPATGWNYAFLKGLESDRTGADTGRRIVDAYFEGYKEEDGGMTLACLDLSKAGALTDGMNAFFSDQSLAISWDTFSVLSKKRAGVTGFGNGVRGTLDDGYDLVDARGLISALGKGIRRRESCRMRWMN